MAKRPSKPKAATRPKAVAKPKSAKKRKPPATRKPTPKKKPVARRTAAAKPTAKPRGSSTRKPTPKRPQTVTQPQPAVVVPVERSAPAIAPPYEPKRSGLSTWWPIVAVLLMIAVVATVAVIRFAGSDSSDVADQGFTADFPTEPTEGSSNFDFGGASVSTKVYMSESGNDAVGVGVTAIPIDSDADIKSALDSAAKSSAGALGYKIKKQKAFTLDGDQALDITAEGEPKIVFQSRFIYHDERVYQLIGIGTNGKPTSAYAPFVQSFRFT
jgi:hypothetical protein